MGQLQGKVALITGGNKESAGVQPLLFARRGHKVVSRR